MNTPSISELNRILGNIDIYMLDQLLKGRFDPSKKILDAGCGEGRNAAYFIQNNYPYFAFDKHPSAIQLARMIAHQLNPTFDIHRFQQGDLAEIPFHDNCFDYLICTAVLHFAQNERQFFQWADELYRVSKNNAIWIVRMAACEREEDTNQISNGTFSFLLDQELLKKMFDRYQAHLIEPYKSVRVEDKRLMASLVIEVRK
ncbi:MAG: class I SAM-dependent methyltransferase [Cyclobacteriaceae bacterium]|nr:class I SAM-dependent methyltransferase [Cyclobacteriaceae bacterium]MCH8517176.1 class I SAM-dependent methyltransferase [Cyclobacteriaceae bacterium]